MIIRNCGASCKDIALFIIFSYLIDFLLLPHLLRGTFSIPAVLLGVNLVKLVLIGIILLTGRYGHYSFNLPSPGFGPVLAASGVSYLGISALNLAAAALFGNETPPPFPSPDGVTDLILILLFTTAAVLVEELFYRKILIIGILRLEINRPTAILASALLFSLGHLYAGVGGMLFSLISGAILAWLCIFSGRVVFPILVHLAYNISALVFSGYLRI